MGRIGIPEMILILVVFVIFFGAAKLPELGSALGKAIRQFKKNLNDVKDEVQKPLEDNAK